MIKQNQTKNRLNIYYDVDAEKEFVIRALNMYVCVCAHGLKLTKFLSFEILFYLPNR